MQSQSIGRYSPFRRSIRHRSTSKAGLLVSAMKDQTTHGGRVWVTMAETNMLQRWTIRSEEHTSELQSLMRISYAVFCLKKKTNNKQTVSQTPQHATKPTTMKTIEPHINTNNY